MKINQMKSSKRLTWIRLLMIISHLVLTAFVIQWLVSQYNSERAILKKELSQQFMEAQEEVMDSMLVIHLIDPIMQGKEIYSLQMDISTDSFPVNRANVFATRPGKGKIDDVMLQSVKLIVQRAADTLYPDSGFTRVMTSMLDTGLLKTIFVGKILEIEERLFPVWHDGLSLDEADRQGIKIYFMCAIPGESCGVEIRNSFWYLAQKTIPATLFGLILLLLTGAAFVISFRSLKNQILLNRIRSDFMSNITHELKTPVATVKVALEALRNFNMQSDPAVTADYLEMASREMNRLDLLINQVLNATSYDNGVHLMEVEDSDLNTLVNEVTEILRPRLDKEGARITIEADDGSTKVPVDRLHVQGVLINLLDNCLKYGGKNPEITIGLTQKDREVIVSIADKGPGIPAEFLEKIFDKFFRVPDGDRHNVKGYGLGLSYAAMVMQQHGGTIRAENREEGGVIFILSFPTKSI
ncbi:MAG: hypothetical protein HQ542_05120 [Bacteroidia bacterium]|nr:hypothetical protein [Bacteroidia bacterium]